MTTHSSFSWRWLPACISLLLLVLSAPLAAQQATGKILGTITDPQGAVLPGVAVAVTNTATQVTSNTITDKDGFYQVLDLPIGVYRVACERQGFKRVTTTTPPLEINQAMRLDLTMQLGTVSETVTVESQPAGVETVNATLGDSITSRPIVNMPLNGRNVLDLARLNAGVSDTNTSAGTSNSQQGSFSVSGAKSDSVTYLLDGGINNDLLGNQAVYTPNPDTIAEFRILTSNYSAEYGRNAGGVVSMVTKSGSNELHGSAYDFVRNDAFNANSFFNKRNGLPRDVLKRQQFGFTVGGPITIPKVMTGKNKFFWFAGYQGQRLNHKVTADKTTVFTPAELAGDFSLSNTDRNGPDPGVVSFLEAHPYFQPISTLAERGIIDPSRIDSVAQKYIAAGMMPTSPSGFMNAQGTEKNDNNELTLKFDIVPNDKDKVSTTLGLFRNPTITPFTPSQLITVPGFPGTGQNNHYFLNIAYTRAFTNAVLNEFRFTAQRNNILQAGIGKKWPTSMELGVGNTPDDPNAPAILYFPSMTVGFNYNGPTNLVDNTFVWSDTLSWIKGKHTMKFGFSFSPYQNNTMYDYFVDGSFNFAGTHDSGGVGSENAFADFLLGLPDNYYQSPRAPSNIRSKQWGAFVQDEWHVRKNLVLNLGLRYEYSSPKLDTLGRSYSFIWGKQSTRFVNAPPGLLFPWDKGAPRGANFPDRNDFAPRFGFAWDPFNDGKTSIRGGFGVFYDVLKGEDSLQFNGQPPFFGYADLYPDPLPAGYDGPSNYLSDIFGVTGSTNPFPSKPPAADLNFDAAGYLPFGGGGQYLVDPHLRTPYIYQYNFSIQRELPGAMTAQLAYVGSSTHKETAYAQANPFILGTTTRLLDTQPGAGRGTYSYMDTFINAANAHYNAFQANLDKRAGSGRWLGNSYFRLAYTWSKSIDNASGFRNNSSSVPAYNHSLFKAVSDYDITHRVSFGGAWELPFQELWSLGPKRLTGGWALYPIVSFRTGFPIDVHAGLSRNRSRPGPSGAGDSNLVRPNLVGSSVTTFDPKVTRTFNGQTGAFWFDPTQFDTESLPSNTNGVIPSDPTYGSLPRNFFRGPGRGNFDLGISKTTPLVSERLKLEFRVEFFNILNHAQFTSPSNGINDPGTFGQISNTYDPRIIQLAARISF